MPVTDFLAETPVKSREHGSSEIPWNATQPAHIRFPGAPESDMGAIPVRWAGVYCPVRRRRGWFWSWASGQGVGKVVH